MDSTLLSRRDLDFLLFEWLAVENLTTRKRFSEHSRETFDGLLDLCEELATREKSSGYGRSPNPRSRSASHMAISGSIDWPSMPSGKRCR
jgi:hypothetical protein